MVTPRQALLCEINILKRRLEKLENQLARTAEEPDCPLASMTPGDAEYREPAGRFGTDALSEETFNEGRDRFRQLLDDIPSVAIQGYGADGTIYFWNKASEAVYGYTAEEAIGRDLVELIIPEHMREEVRKVIRIGAKTGEMPPPEELWLLRRDGSLVPVFSSHAVIRGPEGKAELYCIDLDMRSIKAAEKALESEATRRRILVEQSRDGMVIIDENGKVYEANPQFANMLGYSTEEIGDLHVWDWDAQWTREELQGMVGSVDEHGDRFETRHRRKDGSTYDVEICTNGSFCDGQKLVFCVCRDITQRKLDEAERLRLERRVQQARKTESIGRLASGVAHDLNNLLSPILGYSEMLLDDFEEGDERKEFLRQVVGSSLMARDLVRQLMAFSRSQVLEYKAVDLNRVLRSIGTLLRRSIRENISIEITKEDTPPLILGDSRQLEQVIMNLAFNSQDAMLDGGAMWIRTSTADLRDPAAAEKKGVPPGEYVVMEHGDTGCGMDDQVRERIFEPFFTTKPKGRGTGLGLATVHGIVQQHGGNVVVSSEMGRGTTFEIYLPVPAEAIKLTDVELPDATEVRGSETILLVEDNLEVKELARAILIRRGYRVHAAEHGMEALEILKNLREPVHLLLTDVVMPEMNGRELYERVSAEYPDMKVLYMSGYTDDVIAHQGVLEDGVNFIPKPFTVNALVAKVREVLDEE